MVICRFCLDEDDPDNMISPCKCKGSIRFVHESCLTHWVSLDRTTNKKCFICNTIYRGFEDQWTMTHKITLVAMIFIFCLHIYIIIFMILGGSIT